MSETKIVRYDKAHSSLVAGLQGMITNLKGIDLEREGIEFAIQKMAVRAQKARDLVADRRRRELSPYEPKVKEIKERWKPLMEGFDAVFKRLKGLGSDVLRRQRAEQERLRKEAEKRLIAQKAAAKKKIPQRSKALVKKNIEETAAELEAMPPKGAPLGVKTEDGTLHTRKSWKWQTINVKEVPDIYVQRLVDGKKVDLAVKNGKRTIPGLRVYEYEEMVSRRKT